MSLGKHAPPQSDSRLVADKGGSMVLELRILTVTIVFAFLGAIVIGIF
jgi:hypothetical protein